MQSVWAVVVDTGGAWEADCVYSLWTTQKAAEAEVERLEQKRITTLGFCLGCYDGDAHVIEVSLNTPQDSWIGTL